MRASAECIPCYLRQVLATAKRVSDDEWLHKKVLMEVVSLLPELDLDRTPAEVASDVLKHALRVLGESDPYSSEKKRETKRVVRMARRLQKMYDESEDKLLAAVKLAAIGNIIDLGIQDSYDLAKTVRRVFKDDLAVSHIDEFRIGVDGAHSVMYIFDNAGEVFFDRFLLDEFRRRGKAVTCVARQSPILNDVTLDDLAAIGLDKEFEVMSTGFDGLGVPLNLCSAAFQEKFRASDLVVSKGQANFETLEDAEANVFFILVAKCRKVADALGVGPGQAVLAKRMGTRVESKP